MLCSDAKLALPRKSLVSIRLPRPICSELLHNSSKNIISFSFILPDADKMCEQMVLIGCVHFWGSACGFLSNASPDICLLARKSLSAEGELAAPPLGC